MTFAGDSKLSLSFSLIGYAARISRPSSVVALAPLTLGFTQGTLLALTAAFLPPRGDEEEDESEESDAKEALKEEKVTLKEEKVSLKESLKEQKETLKETLKEEKVSLKEEKEEKVSQKEEKETSSDVMTSSMTSSSPAVLLANAVTSTTPPNQRNRTSSDAPRGLMPFVDMTLEFTLPGIDVEFTTSSAAKKAGKKALERTFRFKLAHLRLMWAAKRKGGERIYEPELRLKGTREWKRGISYGIDRGLLCFMMCFVMYCRLMCCFLSYFNRSF